MYNDNVIFVGLDGAAFASRMPANKLTQMETEIFFDIAHGSQSAIMEFLFIRNKLLQAWLADPSVELTAEKAQAAVILPQAGQLLDVWGIGGCILAYTHTHTHTIHTGKANLVLRVHGYLQRYGYINFGMINRVNPMHGELHTDIFGAIH